MKSMNEHPILGQLKENERRLKDVEKIQEVLRERRRVMDRDGKLTTVAAGFVGITGLFFMKPLSFYLVLCLLVIGLPLVWRHLKKEAREFSMTDEEIKSLLDSQ